MALFGAALFAGCSSDEKEVLGKQGETCERAADCASGLSCYGGQCQVANTELAVTANQCVAIQCETADDCCDSTIFTPASTCSSYQTLCDADSTSSYCALANGSTCKCAPSQFACEENLCKRIECTAASDCCADFVASTLCATYKADCITDPTDTYACTYSAGPSCVCDATTMACNNNQCESVDACTAATAGTDCSFNQVCSSAGVCVGCEQDGDCSGDAKCVGTVCVTPQCVTNSDCAPFYACQSDNTCKKVGCASDRECITYTGSFQATCDTAASPVPTCSVACKTDAQCESVAAANGSKAVWQCVSDKCQDPGCVTDEECKIILSGDAVMSLPGAQAVCKAAAQ